MSNGTKKISAEELERRFDNGEDILEYADMSTVRKIKGGSRIKRITIDCPDWLVEAMDKRAQHLGVTRQSVVKTWLAERAEACDPKLNRAH
jgi:hypothetical protein